jgi:ABC-type multidrug transport system fused ATPase/permease subunit
VAPLQRDIRPELEFRSVWFSYDEDRAVLRNMSFRVEPEETVALVGLNGSGKSTIGLLATGFVHAGCRLDPRRR